MLKSKNLVGQGIVVFLVANGLDEVFLQFFKSGLYAVRRKCVSRDNRSGDVFLQLFQEDLSAAQDLVKRLDGNFFEDGFIDRSVGAVHVGSGRFQPADAAPDDGFAAVVVPVDSPVKLTAFAADNDLCEAMIAGVGTFPTGRAFMYYPAADKFFLHLHEQSIINSITEGINLQHCVINCISLIANENELRNRLANDVAKGIRENDIIQRSVARIPMYHKLNTIKFDTSKKSVQMIVDEIKAI